MFWSGWPEPFLRFRYNVVEDFFVRFSGVEISQGVGTGLIKILHRPAKMVNLVINSQMTVVLLCGNKQPVRVGSFRRKQFGNGNNVIASPYGIHDLLACNDGYFHTLIAVR